MLQKTTAAFSALMTKASSVLSHVPPAVATVPKKYCRHSPLDGLPKSRVARKETDAVVVAKLRSVYTAHPNSNLDRRGNRAVIERISETSHSQFLGVAQEYCKSGGEWSHTHRDVEVEQPTVEDDILHGGEIAAGDTGIAYELACRNALHNYARSGTWYGRDNDRSALKFGDHTHAFAKQLEDVTKKYQALLCAEQALPQAVKDQIHEIFRKVQSVADQLLDIVARFKQDRDRKKFINESSACLESSRLKLDEKMIALHLSPYSDTAFAQTFAEMKLTGLYGEQRISADGLMGGVDERIVEILDEIQMVHKAYDDIHSMVIADFSEPKQIQVLAKLLDERNLSNIRIIPLFETEKMIEWLMENPGVLREHGIDLIMEAGSDLRREAGYGRARVLRLRVNQLAEEFGLTIYHGTGVEFRRNGYSLSESYYQKTKDLMFPSSNEVNTLTEQGVKARIITLDPKAGADYKTRFQKVAIPQSAVDSKFFEQADQVFKPLFDREKRDRSNDSDFARFYRANPILRELRNSFCFSGSRDKKRETMQIFDDRAIQVDAALDVLKLGATFAWDMSDVELDGMINGINSALREGNPVVSDVIENYAMQSADLFFKENCERTWQALKLSAQEIEMLERSRQGFLRVMAGIGYGLNENTALQKQVMEARMISGEYTSDCKKNAAAIARSLSEGMDDMLEFIRTKNSRYLMSAQLKSGKFVKS